MLKFLSHCFTFLILLLVVAVGGGMYVFFKYGQGLPDYQQLAHYEPPVTSRLYANDGKLFAEYAYEKRVYVPIEAIPKRIKQTFLAAEDKNFYHHFGLDFSSIVRAGIMNIKRSRDNKRPVGGSTITQQVAKNFLLNDISNEISLSRKIKEAILALRIEYAYTKDHILELYLNEIYLGSSYGIAAASLRYFNKSLDELTIAEAAFLAGLPKAPSRYDPVRSPKAAKERRDWVIRRMTEEKIITAKEAAHAIQQQIVIRRRDPTKLVRADYFAEDVRRALLNRYGEHILYEGGLSVRTTLDPRLQSIAVKSLRKGLIKYDQRHGWRGRVAQIDINQKPPSGSESPAWAVELQKVPEPAGLKPWQLAVVLSLNANAAKIGFSDGSTGRIPLSEMKWARKYITVEHQGPAVTHPKVVLSVGDVIMVFPAENKGEYSLQQVPKVSGGIIVMDPHTGRVLAMSGGYSFAISQYNRATQAYRQPGSTFKTFVYLAGLEKRVSPSTIIMDSPIAINMGYGLGIWKPENHDEKFWGPTTMRMGFEHSRNTVTIRLTHELVGIDRVIDVARRFGVIENMPKQLAMVLGAGETTLFKLVAGYAMIANGGKKLTPTLIDRIQDRKGKTIWTREARICDNCVGGPWLNQPVPNLVDVREQITDPITAYQTISFLEGSVRNTTGKMIKSLLERPEAGKTGTSNDYFDAWFVGFTPDLVVGVYVGFDEPRTLGPKEYGVRVSAPIYAEFIQEALQDTPAIPFRIPPGIKLVKVNRLSGRQARGEGDNIITEAFRVGTEIPKYEGEPDDEYIADSDKFTGQEYENENSTIPPPTDEDGTDGIY